MPHDVDHQGERPLDPGGPPILIKQQNPGKFNIDLSCSVPQHNVSEIVDRRTQPSVAFLFRFEEVNSHDVFFEWIVSTVEY